MSKKTHSTFAYSGFSAAWHEVAVLLLLLVGAASFFSYIRNEQLSFRHLVSIPTAEAHIGPNGDNPIRWVQGTASCGNGGCTATTIPQVTMPGNVTAGNLLVLSLDYNDGPAFGITVNITDNRGNTWVQAGPYVDQNMALSRHSMWYVKSANGGATTVTATLSALPSDHVDLFLNEYSGVDKINPLDQTASAIGTTAIPTTPNVITTSPNELIVAASVNGSVASAGAGFTTHPPAGLFHSNVAEERLTTTQGSYNATANLGGVADWSIIMATFKADTAVKILEYHINEGAGTVLNDATIYDHDGGSYGAIPATWITAGPGNPALYFSAPDQWIEPPWAPTDHPLFDLTGDFTLSAWVDFDQLVATNPRLIQKGRSRATMSYALGVDTSLGTLRPEARARIAGTEYAAISPLTISTKAWYQLVAVRSGTSLKIFINGVLRNTTAIPAGALTTIPGELLYFGKSVANATGELDEGAMDEISVYSRAMSDAEVLTAFQTFDTTPPTPIVNLSPANAALGVSFTPTLRATTATDAFPSNPVEYRFELFQNPGCTGAYLQARGYNISTTWGPGALTDSTTYSWHYQVRDSALFQNESGFSACTTFTTASLGPIAYWPFDGNALDATGNGHNGTVQNGAVYGLGFEGLPNHAISLDGISQRVDMANPGGTLNNLQTKTIIAWIRMAASGGNTYKDILVKGDLSCGWWLSVTNSTNVHWGQCFSGTSGSWSTSPGSIVANQWYQVAVVYDNSSPANVPVFYINGVPTSLVIIASPIGTVSSDASYTTAVGGESTNNLENFGGREDSVRLYDRALSSAEIASIYAADTAAVCGNNISEATETCDGTDLAGQSCSTQGFFGGPLSCNASCNAFVTTSCTNCGNNLIQAGETCDGTNMNGQTCLSQGFPGGGSLACNASCSAYNTAACLPATCGNNVREGAETCDGTDLAGQSCVLQGYFGGALSCNASCNGYVTASCTNCGNGTIQAGETCDGANMNGQTCLSQGFAGGGSLACNASCTAYNTASCVAMTCGNNLREGSETCDGTDLGGQLCTTIPGGYSGGVLACQAGCAAFNTAACTFPPVVRAPDQSPLTDSDLRPVDASGNSLASSWETAGKNVVAIKVWAPAGLPRSFEAVYTSPTLQRIFYTAGNASGWACSHTFTPGWQLIDCPDTNNDWFSDCDPSVVGNTWRSPFTYTGNAAYPLCRTNYPNFIGGNSAWIWGDSCTQNIVYCRLEMISGGGSSGPQATPLDCQGPATCTYTTTQPVRIRLEMIGGGGNGGYGGNGGSQNSGTGGRAGAYFDRTITLPGPATFTITAGGVGQPSSIVDVPATKPPLSTPGGAFGVTNGGPTWCSPSVNNGESSLWGVGGVGCGSCTGSNGRRGGCPATGFGAGGGGGDDNIGSGQSNPGSGTPGRVMISPA